MSDYTPVTTFTAKDSLAVNDPDKKVVGSELDAEFTAISTAIASKVNTSLLGIGSGVATLNANARMSPDQLWANTSAPSIITSAVTYDCPTSNSFYTVLTENVTINAPANPIDGQTINILLKQDATGGRTVTWNAVFRFSGGSAPTMTATANKADLYKGVYNITLGVWIMVANQNYTVL